MFQRLILAIKQKDQPTACELIAQMSQVQLNLRDHNGYTALIWASSQSLEETCELLVNKMSSLAINNLTPDFSSALTFAASNRMGKTCKLLIDKMSNSTINAIDSYGNTALIFAVKRGLEEVCELLISKMNDKAINSINKKGDSALNLAIEYGEEKLSKLLMTRIGRNIIKIATSEDTEVTESQLLQTTEEDITLYNIDIKRNPHDPETYYYKSNSLFILKKYQESLDCLEQAIKLKPDYVEAYHYKGDVLKELGKYQEAISAYDQAIKLKSDDAESYFKKGRALSSLDKMQDAIIAYDQAIKLKPDDASIYTRKGIELCILGRYQEAITAFDQAIKLKPDEAIYYLYMGNALSDSGKPQKAISAYNQAIKLKPDYVEAHYCKGSALYIMGKHQEAITAFNQTIKLKPDDVGAHYYKGDALYTMGKYQESLDCFERAIKLKPDNIEACHCKGKALYAMGKYQESLDCFEQAIKLKPDDILIYTRKGIELCILGIYQEAITAYSQAIKLKPDYVEAHHYKGNALYATGKYQESLGCFEQVIKLKPDYVEAYYRKGDALYMMGKYYAATTAFDQVIKLKPDNIKAHHYKGKALYAIGKYQESLGCFEQVIKLKPDNIEAHHYKGNALYAMGKYQESLGCFEQVIKLKPDNIEVHHYKGEALYMMGKYQESLDCFERVIKFKPDYVEAHYYKGNALYMMNKHQNAIIAYDQAIQFKSDVPEYYYYKGNALCILGKYQEAVNSYNQAIRLDANIVNAVDKSGATSLSLAYKNLEVLELLFGYASIETIINTLVINTVKDDVKKVLYDFLNNLDISNKPEDLLKKEKILKALEEQVMTKKTIFAGNNKGQTALTLAFHLKNNEIGQFLKLNLLKTNKKNISDITENEDGSTEVTEQQNIFTSALKPVKKQTSLSSANLVNNEDQKEVLPIGQNILKPTKKRETVSNIINIAESEGGSTEVTEQQNIFTSALKPVKKQTSLSSANLVNNEGQKEVPPIGQNILKPTKKRETLSNINIAKSEDGSTEATEQQNIFISALKPVKKQTSLSSANLVNNEDQKEVLPIGQSILKPTKKRETLTNVNSIKSEETLPIEQNILENISIQLFYTSDSLDFQEEQSDINLSIVAIKQSSLQLSDNTSDSNQNIEGSQKSQAGSTDKLGFVTTQVSLTNASIRNAKEESQEKPVETNNNQNKFEVKTMKVNEQTNKEIIIKEIFKLIAEGDARIKEEGEKGILILGKTGTGKSTLTHLLAGQELEAVVDEDTGIMRLEALAPIESIKINHEAISETKIPSKYKIGDVAIWDCPGFRDTGGIAQEIANAFYIQRLVETNKQLKFILTMPDALLSSKSDIIPIVDRFTKGFTNIQSLKESVALVITKAPTVKTKKHIENAINKIIQQNSGTIEPNTVKMLESLLKSLHIFHCPIKEGAIPNPGLFKEIDNSIKYIDTDKTLNLANIVVSEESTKYAKELLETTYINLKTLVDIFIEAIERPTQCITNTPENIFIKSYEFIKSWLPSSVGYSDLNRLPKHFINEHFFNLEQIKAFQELFKTPFNSQNSNSIKDAFLKILEIFEEFTLNNDKLKQQLQEYAHIFKQQIEYTKFLSQVCGNPVVDYGYMEQAIQKCKIITENALEQEIKTIKIEGGYTDIKYYEKATEYLNQYKDDQNCIKTKAAAYYNIGNIYDQQKIINKALLNYIKALELNKEIPKVYEKIGEIFFHNQEYAIAIKCFMVLKDSIKIKNCFKELIKLDPNNPTVRIDQGEYFEFSGNFSKAIECYKDAYSITKDDNSKITIKQKIANLLKQQSKKFEEVADLIEKEGLYLYDKININELQQNIVKIASNDNYEVNNIGNTSDLYG